MRKFKQHSKIEQVLEQIQCNQCGKKIQVENDLVTQGVYSGDTTWGYFSNKDSEHHTFDLCEDCYDIFIKGFKIPVSNT